MKNIILILSMVFCVNVSANQVLALDKAVRSGNLSEVSLLISQGVSPSTVIEQGKNATWKHSPLILAAKAKNVDMVKLLIDSGADVNYVNFGSASALKEAAKSNQPEITTLLIEAGANVNFVDEDQVPILFWAVSKKSDQVIPLLVKAGADPDKKYNSMFHGKNTVRGHFSKPGKSTPEILALLN
jgi:ankyrin repeat protein